MNQKNIEKEIQFKIIYKLKKSVISELTLDISKATFGDIIDYFKHNIIQKYPQFILKSKYYFNGKELDNSNTILNILISQNIEIENIKQMEMLIFLDEKYEIYDKDFPNYKKIIIPKKDNNSFELYIYFPTKGYIDIEEYNEKVYKDYFLNKINPKTSYCNTVNNIFLSGGEYNNEIIDDFWIIDNSLYSIKNMKLPSPKCNHTMFPINNNYILVAGGNDTKTFLYDINKKEFSICGNTNNIHSNPTLFLWKNTIYCFSEQNNKLIIESLLFPQNNYKWENISLNYINDNEILNINKTKYTNYGNENILIILGGNNQYEYNPLNNHIKKYENENNECYFELSPNDKNWYKISKYYNICIPENFLFEKKLIVLNKKYRTLHKMNFIPSDENIKIKHQFEETKKIDEDNNIIINIEYDKNIEKENINLSNYSISIGSEEGNNNIANKKFTFKKSVKVLKPENEEEQEQEIFINEDFNLKDNNISNISNEYKFHKSKSNLIIPNNVAYEQLIHRTSDINENEEDMINIYDNDNNKNIETKKKKNKHNLSSSLINFDKNENKDNILCDEIYFENKKIENDIKEKEKIIKPKINLYLSKNSLDEQLINREIVNDQNEKKEENNKNDSIINPVKRKLNSIEIEENKINNNDNGNNNGGNDMFDDVFSFEAYAGNEVEEEKEQDGIKKSNIFNSKINLYLSQNSLEDQLVERKIDLENKKDENNITNEIK